MRSPSVFLDSSVRPSFLRTTPAKKPRTECCCQLVAFIIAVIVAPVGTRSMAMTRDCFELLILGLRATCWEGLIIGTGVTDGAAGRFLADFGIEILHSVFAASRCTTEAPPRLSSRRGRISKRDRRPDFVTVPLQWRPHASHFWTMLLGAPS